MTTTIADYPTMDRLRGRYAGLLGMMPQACPWYGLAGAADRFALWNGGRLDALAYRHHNPDRARVEADDLGRFIDQVDAR